MKWMGVVLGGDVARTIVKIPAMYSVWLDVEVALQQTSYNSLFFYIQE